MKGYLSVQRDDGGTVEIESRATIYRSAGDSEEILLETNGRTVGLGVSDVTVSRKKGGQAPVVIEPSEEFIRIKNEGNANGITVRTQEEETEVEEGYVANISRDAVFSLGFNAEFRLIVERDARVEQHVVNKGDGDVVFGDQQNVDNSTSVGDDNVLNRSEVGGSEAAEIGDDNVLNRSSTGGSAEDSSPGTTSDDETQFCTECGTELPAGAVACFACGKSLKTDGGSAETRGYCKRHERTYTGETCPTCRDEQ
jgi:hypothetical protein